MRKISTFIIAGSFYAFSATAQTKIPVEEASKHIGQTVTICDKIAGGKFLENAKTRPTLLTMGGGVAANSRLTIVINPEDRKNFPGHPEETFSGKLACVTGKLVDYKGKPEIIVTKPEEIQTLNEGGSGNPEIRTKDFIWFE